MKSLLMTAKNGSKIHNKTKTMTRRIQGLEKVNENPNEWNLLHYTNGVFTFANTEYMKQLNVNHFIDVKPRFQVGDIVSIREPHYLYGKWIEYEPDSGKTGWFFSPNFNCEAKFTDSSESKEWVKKSRNDGEGWYLRPGMFMFEKYVRSHVRINEVICQRLQDISHKDITAEGLGDGYTDIGWNYAFGQLWNSINGKNGHEWNKNEWVFGYRFELV
jgi:hypothetical protein